MIAYHFNNIHMDSTNTWKIHRHRGYIHMHSQENV